MDFAQDNIDDNVSPQGSLTDYRISQGRQFESRRRRPSKSKRMTESYSSLEMQTMIRNACGRRGEGAFSDTSACKLIDQLGDDCNQEIRDLIYDLSQEYFEIADEYMDEDYDEYVRRWNNAIQKASTAIIRAIAGR